jgi:phage gp16-like protein
MATAVQIKLIHTLKGALRLDDDTYRDVLRGYRQTSSKGLSLTQAAELIRDLEQKAISAGVWKTKQAARRAGSRRLADDQQSKMLRGCWIELHKAGIVRNPAEAALVAFGKRLTGKDALQWYTDRDVTIVKKALDEMKEKAHVA